MATLVKNLCLSLTVTQLFPQQQFLHFSKLKGFVDDNFEFDENGGKFSAKVENIVEKGEIAC